VSELLLSGEIEPGQRVIVDLEDGRLTFSVSAAEQAELPKEEPARV
jgi:hypothetical protein